MHLAINPELLLTISDTTCSQRVEKLIQSLQEESDTRRMAVILSTADFCIHLLTSADISVADKNAVATGLSGGQNTADLLHRCPGSACGYLEMPVTCQKYPNGYNATASIVL